MLVLRPCGKLNEREFLARRMFVTSDDRDARPREGQRGASTGCVGRTSAVVPLPTEAARAASGIGNVGTKRPPVGQPRSGRLCCPEVSTHYRHMPRTDGEARVPGSWPRIASGWTGQGLTRQAAAIVDSDRDAPRRSECQRAGSAGAQQLQVRAFVAAGAAHRPLAVDFELAVARPWGRSSSSAVQ